MSTIRLNKLLATRGVGARRKCDALIESGAVRVNGEVVTAPGTRVVEGRDRVQVNGRPLPERAAFRYFMLHKPVGVITTLDDPEGRPTIRELLPPGGRLFPVGRLDADTSGLLIVTNDGDLAHHLMHPRYGLTKFYRVLVEREPDEGQMARLARGVEFEPGIWSAPARVRRRDPIARGAVIEIALHEGRHRQVRRMCEAVGLRVIGLHRWAYGPLRLGELARGMWRELSDDEVGRLRAASSRPRPRPDRGEPAGRSERTGGKRRGREPLSVEARESRRSTERPRSREGPRRFEKPREGPTRGLERPRREAESRPAGRPRRGAEPRSFERPSRGAASRRFEPATGAGGFSGRDRGTRSFRERGIRSFRDRGAAPFRERDARPSRDRGAAPLRQRDARPSRDRGAAPFRERDTRTVRNRGTRPFSQRDSRPFRETGPQAGRRDRFSRPAGGRGGPGPKTTSWERGPRGTSRDRSQRPATRDRGRGPTSRGGATASGPYPRPTRSRNLQRTRRPARLSGTPRPRGPRRPVNRRPRTR